MCALVTGKGNSDMDEEDLLRNGSAILKMPTLVIRHNDSTITTTQPKINLDSGLLMKPRLEFGHTMQWGSSKTQPSLDSTDFLSKTNFAKPSAFGHAGGLSNILAHAKATFGSPSHTPGSFSPHPSGGLGAMKLEPPKPALPTSSNFMTNSTTTLFNTKPATNNNFPTFQSNSSAFGSKQLGSSWPSASGNLNGSVFKTPHFPAKSTFGHSSTFGTQTKPSGFGSSAPAFGQQPYVPPKSVASTFGQPTFVPPKPPAPSFGAAPNRTFGKSTAPKFGSTSFGNSGSLSINRPFTATSSIPPTQRNGEVSQEPVFGSKIKIRRMLATKESQQKKKAAFEQYAGPADTKLSSNPFADAMQRAKNPVPLRTDSDVMEESTGSSDYSEEYDSEMSDVSGFTDEEPQDPIPEAAPVLGDTMERGPSIPYAVAMTPAQPPYASPTKLLMSPVNVKPLSPVKAASPIKQLSPIKAVSQSPERMPVINDVGHESEEVSSIPSPTPQAEPEPILSSPNRKPKRRSNSKTPQHIPSNTTSPAANHELVLSPPITKKIKRAEDIIKEIESPKVPSKRASRQIKTSPEYAKKTTPNHVSPAHKANGDMPREVHKPSNEVGSHLDLDSPSMCLSIPRALLKQATGNKVKKAPKVRKPSGRPPRRQSARTPNYPSFPTPSQVPPTPAYPTAPSTPEHPSATPAYTVPATPAYRPETPMYAPPTPAYPSQTPSHPSSAAPKHMQKPVPVTHDRRIHAPTKAEMMEKMMKKQKELEKAARKAKAKKPRIGPKSFMRRIGKQVESEPEMPAPVDDSSLFYKSELISQFSGRTDQSAPYRARFKQNQLYLCYLRRRALDLVHSLFPDLRCGGNFCPETEDIDGLLEYIITSLENQDSSTRCMHSLSDSGREPKNKIEVRLCRAGKNTVRSLQRKLVILLKLVLPSLSLQQIDKEGIQTLPKLIHKVITENSVR